MLSDQIEKIARKIKCAGTWSLPDEPNKIDILEKYLKDLKNNQIKKPFNKILDNILGDDDLWDRLDEYQSELDFGEMNKKEYATILRLEIIDFIKKLIKKYEKNNKHNLDIESLNNLVKKYK